LEDLINLNVIAPTQTSQDISMAPSTIYSYSGSDLRRWGIRSIGVINIITKAANANPQSASATVNVGSGNVVRTDARFLPKYRLHCAVTTVNIV